MNPTRRVVYAGLLTGLSVVFTRLLSFSIPFGGVHMVRLGFGPLPIIVAGLLLGPGYGAAVGAVADVVGYSLNPGGGAYIPYITLSSALAGAIPPLVMRRKSVGQASFGDLLVAIGVGQFVTAILLTPYFLQKFFGIPYLINLPFRLISQAVLVPAYSSVVHVALAHFRPSAVRQTPPR